MAKAFAGCVRFVLMLTGPCFVHLNARVQAEVKELMLMESLERQRRMEQLYQQQLAAEQVRTFIPTHSFCALCGGFVVALTLP